MDMEEESDD
uniref:Uncharacterized protein n=1 Tax=Rhizophora mucronata TaxID=61149 RepID=A0A2P2PDZ0_RHIMU